MSRTTFQFGKRQQGQNIGPQISTYNFAELSGDTLVDSTNGINGTTFGTIVNCLGKKHRSQIFLQANNSINGSYARIPHHDNFNIFQKFTVEGFITFKDIPSIQGASRGVFIAGKRNSTDTSNGSWQMLYFDGKIQGGIIDENGNFFTSTTAFIPVKDQYYHLALIVDTSWNDCIKLYINGVLQASDTAIGTPIVPLKQSTSDVYFNQTGWANNLHAFAQYEGWTIRKNIALTQAVIQAKIDDYNNSPAPSKVPVTNDLALHWNFNETAAPIVESINNLSASPTGNVIIGGSGVSGNSLEFQGGELRYPHNSVFQFFNGVTNFDFCFSCWLRFDQFKNGWIFNKRSNTGNDVEYQLSVYGGLLRFQTFNSNGGNQLISYDTSNLNLYEWIKVSGFTIKSYGVQALVIDNQIVGYAWDSGNIKNYNWNISNKDFVIGRAEWDSSFWMDGKIDQLKFWKGANVPKGFFFHE